MAVNQSQHRHLDANLQVTVALPAAAATAYTAAIDTRSGGLDIAVAGASQTVDLQGNAALERAELLIEIPATPALVDDKDITVTIQSSGDDASTDAYAAVENLPVFTITGVATSQGGPAFSQRVKLPSNIERYIRVAVAVESGGGSNIAVSLTASLLT